MRPLAAVLAALLALASCAIARSSAERSTLALTSPAPSFIVLVLDDANEAQTLTRLTLTKQRMKAHGVNVVTFERAYCSTPTCSPARATLLTGRFAHEHGVHYNSPDEGPLGGAAAFVASGAVNDTLATRLSSAGYATALVGKYLNFYEAIVPPIGPPGWSYVRAFHLQGSGFFNYTLAEQDGTIQARGSSDADYSTDVFAARALSVVAGAAASGQPLLLWLAPFAPHDPAIPASRHAGLFPNAPVPRPPSYANLSTKIGKPDWVQPLTWTAEQGAADDASYRSQLRSLVAVDEMMAALIDAVAAAGRLDSTLFVVTTDNGLHHGEHFWRGKLTPYEPAVRTPIVFAGRPPLVPAPGSRSQLAGNVDLAPTLLALAGEPLAGTSGVSLAPLIASDGPWPREDLLLERRSAAPGGAGIPERPMPTWAGLVARRQGKLWKYVELTNSPTVDRELYDLSTDPHEISNLAADPGYAPLVAELSERLAVLLPAEP